MSIEDEDRAHAGLERFYRACRRPQPVPDAVITQGCAARVLAASKPGGMILNVDAPELAFFIADGMDIASQLVSVITDAKIHAALKESLRDDIRISVHGQHPVALLGDVRDHRFDLMTFGSLEPAAARLAAASLAPGGLLALFPTTTPGGAHAEAAKRTLIDCGMVVSSGIHCALIAAPAPNHIMAKRLGGRRKRPPARG